MPSLPPTLTPAALAPLLDRVGRPELKQTARVAAAALLATVFAMAAHLPQPTWATISALIVIQSNTGGSLRSAVNRLLGTLGGAVAACLAAALIPAHLGVESRLAVAIVPLALFTVLFPDYRAATIAAVIVLLNGAIGGPLHGALARLLEITVGSGIALLVSLLVFPTRADALARTAVRKVLELTAAALTRREEDGGVALMDSKIFVQFRPALRQLLMLEGEIKWERRMRLTRIADIEPYGNTARRVMDDLRLLNRLTQAPFPASAREFARSLETCLSLLRAMALDVAGGRPLSTEAEHEFTEAQQQLRERRGEEDTVRNGADRRAAIRFALGQLSRSLLILGRQLDAAPLKPQRAVVDNLGDRRAG